MMPSPPKHFALKTLFLAAFCRVDIFDKIDTSLFARTIYSARMRFMPADFRLGAEASSTR